MKKSTMQTIVDYINANGVEELAEVRDELNAELAKGKEKADANRAVYAEIHDKVVEVLTREGKPLTAQEIADETGVARGKIVYGLTNYWADEVERDQSGKACTYALKA